MVCCINSAAPTPLDTEWFGARVTPPWFFRFSTEGNTLVFRVSRDGVPCLAPGSRPDVFTPELWKYDTAEFFIATPDLHRYAEFNLALNGAWWAAVFCAPRVPDPDFGVPQDICARAEQTAGGFAAELRVPQAALRSMGMPPEDCRLAAAAIARHADGRYTFLTTAEHRGERPDFHQPDTWPRATLLP